MGQRQHNTHTQLTTSFPSLTRSAPLDSAFTRLHPALQGWLWDPANTVIARYIALSSFLRGDTYVYDCSFAVLFRAWRAGRASHATGVCPRRLAPHPSLLHPTP